MTLSRFVVKMQIVHEYLPLTLVSPGKGLCLRLFCYNYNLGNIHSGEERVRAGFWASSKVFCLWWGSCYKFRIQQILTTVLWHSAYMWMLWQQEPWARQSGKKTPKINNLYCGEFTRLTWPEVSGQEGGRKTLLQVMIVRRMLCNIRYKKYEKKPEGLLTYRPKIVGLKIVD